MLSQVSIFSILAGVLPLNDDIESIQNRFKFVIDFLIDFGTDFGSILGCCSVAFGRPRRPEDAPRRAQDAPRRSQDAPRWPQDGTRMVKEAMLKQVGFRKSSERESIDKN